MTIEVFVGKCSVGLELEVGRILPRLGLALAVALVEAHLLLHALQYVAGDGFVGVELFFERSTMLPVVTAVLLLDGGHAACRRLR